MSGGAPLMTSAVHLWPESVDTPCMRWSEVCGLEEACEWIYFRRAHFNGMAAAAAKSVKKLLVTIPTTTSAPEPNNEREVKAIGKL